MSTSRAPVSWAGCLLLLLCLPTCQRPQEPTEPVPPFSNKRVRDVNLLLLYDIYETDPTEADKAFKGKILSIEKVADLSWAKAIRRDGNGRQYIPVVRWRSGKPNETREIARFYLYRPENPIVEECRWSPQASGVKGICKGRWDGVIILENCSVFTHFVEGNDW